MTAPMCMWEQCDRPAQIRVAVRKRLRGALAHGAFCLPHSALTSRALHHRSGAEVWFDWLRDDHDVTCACDPLDLSMLRTGDGGGATGRFSGEPRLRGFEGPDEVDPVEWAR